MIPATRLLARAAQLVGRPYVLGVDVPLWDPTFNQAFDCAELVSYVVTQVTGRVLGVLDPEARNPEPYSGAWAVLGTDSPLAPAGPPGSVIAATTPLRVGVRDAIRIPGAVLVRAPVGGAMGHVVFVAENGATIEAHSTARGVIRDTCLGRRWDVGVLVPGVEYVRGAEIPSTPPRVLRLGATGAEVRELQALLVARGVSVAVDGSFGRGTLAAVVGFQSSHGLVADGEVGPLTWAALRAG